MFSHRVTSKLEKNRLTLLLEQKKQRGTAILDLTGSNPTQANLAYPEDILSSLNDCRSLLYHPSAKGLMEARTAVARYYCERGQGEIDPEDIVLTASTSEAYAFLFKLLADPHQNILAPQPSYPLLDFLAAGEAIDVVRYPLIYHDRWQLHITEITDHITSQTRALVAVTPNNPTGSFLKVSEWNSLKETCSRHKLPLICDEVFFDYPLDETISRFDPIAEQDVLTFVLSGLSKVVGLPQMKMGWIVIRGPKEQRRLARERLEIISDTFLSVNTPVQHASPKLLQIRVSIQEQIRLRIQRNLTLLEDLFSASSLESLPVEGGWYVVVRVPDTRSEEAWALHLLADYNTSVHPGYFYDFYQEPFLVLSLLTPEKLFKEGIGRLLEAAG